MLAPLGLASSLFFAGGCEPPAGEGGGTDPEPASNGEDSNRDASGEVASVDDFVGPPEPEFVALERLVITGATVLSGFDQDADGIWSASVLDDTTVVIEDGEVTRLVASSAFRLGLGDVVVTGKGRFVMAAPIVVGGASPDGDPSSWLEGGRLVDAALSGIAGVALPEDLVDGPGGRCVLDRIGSLEIPGASPLAADPGALEALQGAVTLGLDSHPGAALDSAIRERVASGEEPIEILSGLTQAAAASLARPDLGMVEIGSRSRLLVLEGDPTADPTLITRPHAMTFGDRVMRRAEIEVLRDASVRGRDMRARILELSPGEGREDSSDDPVRRWYTSTQSQVFAGVAAKGPAGDLFFTGRTGQPRFDRVDGRIRLRAPENEPNLEMIYDGPPQSFEIRTDPRDSGLDVRLAIEDAEPIRAESPGPSGPPIIDLAIDLDLRREAFVPNADFVLELQELVYGNGPIGLAPRRYRFVPVEVAECPPCFEGFEQVWRLEIIDPDRGDDLVAAEAYVGFRDGRPSRAKFDAGADAVWVEEYPAIDRPSID